MGRIRTIKPEILEDEKTANLSHLEWRVFVSLFVLADDYGNLRGEASYVHGAALWASRHTREPLAKALDSLASLSLLAFYEVRGQRYIHIVGWEKHQKVDKPGKPRMPGPSDGLAIHSRDSRETLAPDPDPDHDPEREHDLAHARAIPRGTAEVGVQPRTNGHEDPALVARRRLGSAIWDELNASRVRVAKKLNVEAEQLHEHDPGRRELAERIVESGDNAERRCRHVILVTELEAVSTGTMRWLSGGLFKPERWRNALAMTAKDVKPRDSPESTGPSVNPYSDDF